MSGYIIGIDPGTNCGWAVLNDLGGRLASGAWNLAPRRHEGGGMRYLRFRRYLNDVLSTYTPTIAVVYEEVRRHRGTDAAHVYGGIVSQLGALCEELEIPYAGIPVGTVKKAATGKGNANKEAMVAAADRRFRFTPESDDEADALWIAEAWRTERDP